LRTFENKVLRGIFGPKRGEITGVWTKFKMMSFKISRLALH
jgi:hypothetical protein